MIKEKLKLLKEDLKRWNRDVFGSIDKKIGELKNEIHELEIYGKQGNTKEGGDDGIV